MSPRLALIALVAALAAGCARPVPTFDPARVPAELLARCQEAGAVIVSDEHYEDYSWKGYDPWRARLLAQAGAVGGLTVPEVFRRTVFKVETREAAAALSRLEVLHTKEQPPIVEAVAWTADGRQRPMNVEATRTEVVADWRCTMEVPRRTTFRLGPINPGDTFEVRYPLSGPEQETWSFADPRFCVLASRVTFGHPEDTNSQLLGMDALLVDATGLVERASADGVHPMVFESTRPLPALPPERVPYVTRTGRCRGFEYLQARVFLLPLWAARDGRPELPPELVAPVGTSEERTARVLAVKGWLRGFTPVPAEVSLWMRWLPREPLEVTAAAGRGSAGSIALLAFRALEEAGLAPRLALLHMEGVPFNPDFASPTQFDALAVVVADGAGVDHWLLPGLQAEPAEPVPAELRYRWALRMERWVAERVPGGGACSPAMDQLFACDNEAKPVESVRLVRPGRP
ncbi:MAG TPA: hypothetical protein P5076_20545 [Myxococcota bacterium]|nr:hypothetical protein [Myxococcota bacterium]